MKLFANWGVYTVLALLIVVSSVCEIVASEDWVDPMQELQGFFPNSIQINAGGGPSIEFCPDNTCHYFVGDKKISLETVKDFAYLYIYFFSDYFVLDEWRNRKESIITARKILSKPIYKGCKKDEGEAARCILRRMAQSDQVKLYFVRYDEGKRNLVSEDVFARTAQAPVKMKQK